MGVVTCRVGDIRETILWSFGTQTVELDNLTLMEKVMSIEMVIITVRKDQSCVLRYGHMNDQAIAEAHDQEKTLIS